jgi:DNA-binding transcriptional regulator YiaG
MESRLRAHGLKLAAARDRERQIREETPALIVEAASLSISQRRIAELLGVDRMTVRKWVGQR